MVQDTAQLIECAAGTVGVMYGGYGEKNIEKTRKTGNFHQAEAVLAQPQGALGTAVLSVETNGRRRANPIC